MITIPMHMFLCLQDLFFAQMLAILHRVLVVLSLMESLSSSIYPHIDKIYCAEPIYILDYGHLTCQYTALPFHLPANIGILSLVGGQVPVLGELMSGLKEGYIIVITPSFNIFVTPATLLVDDYIIKYLFQAAHPTSSIREVFERMEDKKYMGEKLLFSEITQFFSTCDISGIFSKKKYTDCSSAHLIFSINKSFDGG
ncbi:hypothetical protein ACJX0J_040849 [Zea mays]